jgi:hypothetical protein
MMGWSAKRENGKNSNDESSSLAFFALNQFLLSSKRALN